MKVVPLAEGDPAWVFPEAPVTEELALSLTGSSGRLAEIAALLVRGRAGISGPGLEYNVFPVGEVPPARAGGERAGDLRS